MNTFRQFFFIPEPVLTERNCPDQHGRVHIVTGGYSGCGFELCKILYHHNATIYIAGRSEDKLARAIDELKTTYPSSTGRVEGLILDLADLSTIKPAVERFAASQKLLHVLTLNAGVMLPPEGSTSAQDVELQMATNCLGSYLFYTLLRPTLYGTAQQLPPASVRVTWAGSIVIDTSSPKQGGIMFVSGTDEPQILKGNAQYGQSKTGNLVLAAAMARHDAEHGVLHLCWNPGNLKTQLSRHMSSIQKAVLNPILSEPIYGAYTELWAALADVPLERSGAYVQPWGRFGTVRADIQRSCVPMAEGGNGTSERFVKWCEQTTLPYT